MSRMRESGKAERGEEAQVPAEESELVARLRAGDEAAFHHLVDRLHGRMLGLARSFCSRAELAEEVVQETWLAVIRGLDGRMGSRQPSSAGRTEKGPASC